MTSQYRKHRDVIALKQFGFKYHSRGYGRGLSWYNYKRANGMRAQVTVHSNQTITIKYWDIANQVIPAEWALQ